MAFFVKTFYFGQMSKFDPPVFVFVFVCAYLYLCVRICICICVFVFVFDHDHLLFWFIFDENPFLRLRLALHEYLESAQEGGNLTQERSVQKSFRGWQIEDFCRVTSENLRLRA